MFEIELPVPFASIVLFVNVSVDDAVIPPNNSRPVSLGVINALNGIGSGRLPFRDVTGCGRDISLTRQVLS
jgi:hypothetical protein